jgi:eukaryotic-like serine/threonine-protein kinase
VSVTHNGAAMSPNADNENVAGKRTRVGGFEIVQKLGQGGMGAVFKAIQLSIDRPVALKILPPRFAKNEDYLARFFREARSAAKLNHPNIVQAIDAGEADGYHYFAMEFVDGHTVADFIQGGKWLPEKEALRILGCIAKALDYAHKAGIIHRDIKPANILLTTSGQPKLADLGLARQAANQETDVTQAGYAIGTPDYISPEQVRGDTGIDGRTDVYSLGATLFRLLTGQPPYAGGTGNEVMAKHLAEPIPDPKRINPEVSAAAARIVWRAMAKDPNRRYKTAGDMALDIERALSGDAVPGARGSRRPQRATGQRSKAPLIVGVGLLAAALAVVVAVLTQGPANNGNGNGNDNGNGGGPIASTPPANNGGQSSADQKALAYLRKWVKDHPDEYAKALARYKDAVRRMTQNELILKAKDDIDALSAGWQAAAHKAFDPLKAKADALAKTHKYDDAIAVYGNVPNEFAPLLSKRAQDEAKALRSEARNMIKAAMGTAGAASKAGNPDQGLAALDKIAAVQFAELTADLAALRKRLSNELGDRTELERKRALAAARAGVDKLLEQIEGAAGEDDCVKAGLLADLALKDPALQPDAERLKMVARIGQIMRDRYEKEIAGAVRELSKLIGQRGQTIRTTARTYIGEVRKVSAAGIVLDPTAYINNVRQRQRPLVTIAFKDLDAKILKQYCKVQPPRTVDEHMAATVLAYGRAKPAQMEAALASAKDHALYDRYAAKLAELKLGSAEASARRTWRKIEPYDVKRKAREKLRATDALELRKLLDSFEKEHKGTECAAAHKDAVPPLREYLIPVYKKWPFSASEASRRQKETAAILGIPVTKSINIGQAVTIEFVLIPASEFVMGTPGKEPSRQKDEGPQHRLLLAKPFYIGKYEVTQRQWQEVMKKNPSRFRSPTRPVETVALSNCQAFLKRLSTTGKGHFRLPSEAEWEFACRAGTATPFYFGKTVRPNQANFKASEPYPGAPAGKNPDKTALVGRYSANQFSIHDMSGNVWEWVDGLIRPYPLDAEELKPSTEQVVRGGSWLHTAVGLRSGNRWSRKPETTDPDLGFRVVVDLPND